jgi:proline dehydrogenase
MLKTPLNIFKGALRSSTELPFRLLINSRICKGTYVPKGSRIRYSHGTCNSSSISKKVEGSDSHARTTMSNAAPIKLPNFLDPHAAYHSKTNWELIRAIIVLKLCEISFLVENGSKIIECSYQLLGRSITNAFIGPLLFQQFCAGEDFKKTTDSLRRNGILSILDYCAEAESCTNISQLTGNNTPKHQKPINQPARIYTYYSEAQCDRHRDNFLDCIRAIRDTSSFDDGQGKFMALKVTALGNPKLLERVSSHILRSREEFSTKRYAT